MNSSVIAGFIVFRLLVPALFVLIQIVLARKTLRWARSIHPDRRWLRFLIPVPFTLASGILLYGLIFRQRDTGISPFSLYAVMYPYYIWQGATILLGLFLSLAWALKFLIRKSRALARQFFTAKRTEPSRTNLASRFDPVRRTVLRRGMYGVTAAAFGATGYGLIVESTSLEQTTATFPIAGLTPELDGFTIALVSDIHSSEHMPKAQMEMVVRALNALHADMIVVDGDFVNSRSEEVYPFAEAFSALRAPCGVHGVLGNHDYYSQDPDLIARVVDDAGISIMRNNRKIITKNGASMYLVGVDDVGRNTFGQIKLDEAIGSTPLAIPKIVLCHRPYYFPEMAARNIDLVLSGHTHGGQIVLAKFGNLALTPAALVSPYVWGKYHSGASAMYVSRGIGTVGLPVRIGCPPEITLIRLTKQS